MNTQDNLGEHIFNRLEAVAAEWVSDGIEPRVIAIALAAVAGNIAARSIGPKRAADWFTELSTMFADLAKPDGISIN